MILDQLKKPKITNQSQQWNFITDQVMGGVSTGKFRIDEVDGIKCYRMIGDVSTKNNGGFIQIRTKLIPEIDSNNKNNAFIKICVLLLLLKFQNDICTFSLLFEFNCCSCL